MRPVILSLLALAATAPAQDLAPVDFTHFEVALVKPVGPLDTPSGARAGSVPVFLPQGGPGTDDPEHFSYRGAWLMNLITTAYNLRGFQLPLSSLSQERYDIIAKIPPGATKEQFNVMLQNLLRERFHFTFHLESKTFPAYVLVIGKNGSKLKESSQAADPAPGTAAARPGFPSLPPDFSGAVGYYTAGVFHLAGQRAPLAKLVPLLENHLDRPIVDQTGLTGEYDFKLEFEGTPRPVGQTDALNSDAPALFSAVEKELGLKLEPSKASFDVMIVDRLDKVPTAN